MDKTTKLTLNGTICSNDGVNINCDAGDPCDDIISGQNTTYDKAFKINRIKSTCGEEEDNQYIYNDLSQEAGVSNLICCGSIEDNNNYWIPKNNINGDSFGKALPGLLSEEDFLINVTHLIFLNDLQR